MTIHEALLTAANEFTKSNVPSPALDGEVLLCEILKSDRTFLYAHPEYRLSDDELQNFDGLVTRRARREPVAYITNKKEFFGYNFFVDDRVLIPRPETERLVESALECLLSLASAHKSITIVDVGTGSGCIIISLMHELRKKFGMSLVGEKVRALGIDISLPALAIARRNSAAAGFGEHIRFEQGDLLEPVELYAPFFYQADFGLICANLPYIPAIQLDKLEPEILKFEPHAALVTPNSPMYFYDRLLMHIETLQKHTRIPLCALFETPWETSFVQTHRFPLPYETDKSDIPWEGKGDL